MNTPNFSDIYTLYFEDVYKYLLALCHDEELAEELAQDTFFKAMKSYENFRGDCKITTWLCQIAKHSFFLYEKHRKRNIDLPILTLAVMLLMVGGVYAVFSSTQPEKSKAENVRDTTDQDYEKGLTEEQKAFNELINKQIYEETANNLEQYEQYGLTYNSNENQLFFNGKSVCYFADNRATDGTFEGTEVHSANGDIGIITERDRNGNITGLKQMEIPELTDFLEKSWKEK